MALIKCPECKNDVSSIAKACPKCGAPIDTKVHCPKCQSTNVKTISGLNKAATVAALGVFAINKVMCKYRCYECWHKF